MAAKALSLFFLLILAASFLPAIFAEDVDDESEALAKDADFIDELPNQPEGTNFRQYSGYLVAEPVNYRRFFYYFVEADDIQPLSKPLLIYIGSQTAKLHGSPLTSCFQQIGPFTVELDGQTLNPNPFSWNKLVNILFIDSPVGVGFSTSNNVQDQFKTHEYWYIADLYHSIVNWMKRFPEHKNNDVYIGGQYYIGTFGPALATYILYKNTVPDTPLINIRGILMGNPSLDEDTEFLTRFESMFRMNLISDDINQRHRKLCKLGRPEDYMICWGPVGDAFTLLLTLQANNVYAKFCPNIVMSAVDLTTVLKYLYECYEEAIAGYLNIPFVQKMMHVEMMPWGPPTWKPYTGMGSDYIEQNISSSKPYIKAAMTKGVRILMYSGVQDEEIIIPNFAVIKSMNLTLSSEWRPWFDNTNQLAGFTESYVGGLTYVTVRASGNKVMVDQPERGFIVAKSFFTNSTLPFTKFV